MMRVAIRATSCSALTKIYTFLPIVAYPSQMACHVPALLRARQQAITALRRPSEKMFSMTITLKQAISAIMKTHL
jgi:hypothetical protein